MTIERILSGDEDVLIDIYKKYRNEFIVWCVNRYHCKPEDAKDIFQDTLIDFYSSIKSGKLKSINYELKTYLFAIGKFKLINFLKKNRRSVTYDAFDLLMVNEPTENQIMDNEEQEFIKATVKKYLAEQCEDCKKVLEMYYFKEMDMDSIAKEMGYKNRDVAKKKKYECFKKLAEMVKKNLTVMIF